jgi:hypothetical protein
MTEMVRVRLASRPQPQPAPGSEAGVGGPSDPPGNLINHGNCPPTGNACVETSCQNPFSGQINFGGDLRRGVEFRRQAVRCERCVVSWRSWGGRTETWPQYAFSEGWDARALAGRTRWDRSHQFCKPSKMAILQVPVLLTNPFSDLTSPWTHTAAPWMDWRPLTA